MKTRFAVAAVLTTFAVPAFSQQLDQGFYVGAGIGQSTIEEDTFDLKASDLAWQLFAGYRFLDYIAAEIGYIDAGSPEDSIGTITASVDTTGFQVSALPTLPISDTFAIYGRLGLLAWEQEARATNSANGLSASLEDDGNEFFWGVGLQFSNRTLGFRVEYNQADVEDTTYSLIGASIVIGFE